MILACGFEHECNGEIGVVLLSCAVHENHPTPHPHPDFIDLRAQTWVFLRVPPKALVNSQG